MAEGSEELEELVRRPERRGMEVPTAHAGATPLGQCVCGARITQAEVHGERRDVDLGRPRRLSSSRIYQYRCSLCGHSGELEAAAV